MSGDLLDKKTAVLIFVLLVAGVFRFSYLGWGLPNDWHPYSYHPDEAKQLDSIANMHPDKLDFNPDEFIYPSLQYYINAGALGIASVFGYVKLVPDIAFYISHPHELSQLFFVGRLVTAIFSIATVFLVFLIGKRLYDYDVGITAAFIFALIPQHIIESHYMTVDVPMTFWITLTLFFSTYVLKEDGWNWYALAGLSAGFATATKYPGVFAWFFILGAHVIRRYAEERATQSVKDAPAHMQAIHALGQIPLFERKLLVSSLLLILGFFLASPYVFIDYKHSIPAIVGQWDLGKTTQFDNLAGNGMQYHRLTYSLFAAFPFLLGIPLFCLFIYSLWASFRKHKDQTILLLSFALPFFLLFGTSRFIMLRYYLPFFPIIALMTGSIVIGGKKIIHLLAAITLFYLTLFAMTQNNKFTNDTQDQATIWIYENIPENATIVVSPWSPLRYTPLRDPLALSGREVNDAQILSKRAEQGLDVGRYRVLTLYNASDWEGLFMRYKPDYVVMSSLDWSEYARNQSQAADYISSLNFYNSFRTGEMSFWSKEAIFNRPYLNSELYSRLDPRFLSSYASPSIEIYKFYP